MPVYMYLLVYQLHEPDMYLSVSSNLYSAVSGLALIYGLYGRDNLSIQLRMYVLTQCFYLQVLS